MSSYPIKHTVHVHIQYMYTYSTVHIQYMYTYSTVHIQYSTHTVHVHIQYSTHGTSPWGPGGWCWQSGRRQRASASPSLCEHPACPGGSQSPAAPGRSHYECYPLSAHTWSALSAPGLHQQAWGDRHCINMGGGKVTDIVCG